MRRYCSSRILFGNDQAAAFHAATYSRFHRNCIDQSGRWASSAHANAVAYHAIFITSYAVSVFIFLADSCRHTAGACSPAHARGEGCRNHDAQLPDAGRPPSSYRRIGVIVAAVIEIILPPSHEIAALMQKILLRPERRIDIAIFIILHREHITSLACGLLWHGMSWRWRRGA